MPGTVLIVDDEVQLVRHLEHLLRREGYQAIGVHDGEAARTAVATFFPDVVLLDLKLPDIDGNTLLTELAERHPTAGYVIITAFGSIRSAVEATRRGAREYLTKPFEPDELLLAVRNAMRDRLRDEEIKLLRKTGRPGFPGSTAGAGQPHSTEYPSEAMRNALTQARHAASSDSIVLLLGESGSGKDFLTRYIHDRSRRANGPFFAINCAAVAPELAESELFGHEPGAFTGARGRKRGLLELAEGGTLLLNEIGELSMPMQAKLLTFLDTRSFTRVGGEAHIPVNARLIAATNKELDKEVARGGFRSDLYYRLNVLSIRIPPLRRRMEDLPMLVREILAQLSDELGLLKPIEADARTLAKLSEYNWPGNVRELRNVLERGLMLSDSGRINLSSMGVDDHQEDWSYVVNFPVRKSIHDVTREVKKSLVFEALRRSGGSKQGAARLLGISRHAFAHQMKAIGLTDDEE
ncbi:MAG: sigma-54-dependent Fis family transcriptional regulator [Desulfomonile tiedjei]|uniref:Sigma-54-dependent Fis family transcriptional regulator n=1 Tax=Desulfomonile tiedjei TaxID=2358 RepID=A0A9D6Z2E5_9BACT|nr:sigma-54-dependent Fis family transcriptional regulator [Desulfomonile tiedjei]